MDDRDSVIRARALGLTALVEDRLPETHVVTGDADAWPMVAAGLTSRATTSLRSMFHLLDRRQALDAATVGRSLYEHVVHLAYLAADPSPARLEEWRRVDLKNRLRAYDDARMCGELLFDDDVRAGIEAQVEQLQGADRLPLTNLAAAADEHWAGKLPGMGPSTERSSFRGLYVWVFRNYSGTAHPSYIGLNHVVEDVSPTERRVVLEKEFEGRGPYGMATVIYGLGLYVMAATFGWPTEGAVTGVFDSYPG